MNNLTVNMPLAVPHQRPPSKYASHPYPAHELSEYKCSTVDITSLILRPWFSDELSTYQASAINLIDITITQMLFPVINIQLPNQKELYKANLISVNNIKITQLIDPIERTTRDESEHYKASKVNIITVSIVRLVLIHNERIDYKTSSISINNIKIYEGE